MERYCATFRYILLVALIGGVWSMPDFKIHQAREKTYSAAVIEYALKFGNTSANIQNYVKILKSADVSNLDIIVFPEGCLNSPKDSIPVAIHPMVPACQDSSVHRLLRDISCAVQAARAYTVINVMMKSPCNLEDPCPSNQDYLVFNTAVVFDRDGVIIAKYRKYHLAGERGVQPPSKVDIVSFDTDFGVTFGVFICFDVFFKQPMNSLLEQGVRHFVFPTFWFNELPFLSGLQAQYGWAYAKNITLLAANANLPDGAVSGSGIFSGRAGALDMYVSSVEKTRIMKAQVPFEVSSTGKRQPVSISSRKAITLPNLLSAYNVKFLDFGLSKEHSGKICHEKVCCSYKVNVTEKVGRGYGAKSYSYAIAAIDGTRDFRGQMRFLKTGLQVCSLVACTDFGLKDTCGQTFDAEDYVFQRYEFDQVDLKLETAKTDQMIWVNTLASNLLPLDANDYVYDESNFKSLNSIDLKLTSSKTDLLTFAIYVRDFTKDTYKGEPIVDRF